MIDVLLRTTGLTAIYLLVLGSLHPLDVLVGVLISVLLVVAGRRIRPPAWRPTRPAGTTTGRRLAGIPALVAGSLVDVARGTWEAARFCLARRPTAGVVTVAIGRCAPSSAAVWAVRVTLAPDTIVVDVDDERGELSVHVLDASDPEAVRTQLQDLYERRQRRVFP